MDFKIAQNMKNYHAVVVYAEILLVSADDQTAKNLNGSAPTARKFSYRQESTKALDLYWL